MATHTARTDGIDLERDEDLEWSPVVSMLTNRPTIIGGAAKAMERFIASFRPSLGDIAAQYLAPGKSGPLSHEIERGGRAAGATPKLATIQRNLQRWRAYAEGSGKQSRKPSLKLIEQYQDWLVRATGKRNAGLGALAGLVSGHATPQQLGKGDLTIRIFGDIEAYPEQPENRPPREVAVTVLDHEKRLRAEAILDPVGTWLELFGTEVELYEIDWIEFSFTER